MMLFSEDFSLHKTAYQDSDSAETVSVLNVDPKSGLISEGRKIINNDTYYNLASLFVELPKRSRVSIYALVTKKSIVEAFPYLDD